MSGSKINQGHSARQKGARKARRRHRAERREATREIRERINARRRAEGHPGWVHPEQSLACLRRQGVQIGDTVNLADGSDHSKPFDYDL